MNITESIKFNKIKEENEIFKKELDEKDKEIMKLKQQQLYKEDFEIEYYDNCECTSICACGNALVSLIDNSKWELLDSKDVK